MKTQSIFNQTLTTFLLSTALLLTGYNLPKLRVSAGEIKAENKQIKNNNKIGKFLLTYEPSSPDTYKEGEIEAILSNREIRELLIDSKIFENIISNLNNSGLIMRQDIPVIFRECGTANAFWSPSQRAITVCYENMALDLILFHQIAEYSPEKAVEKSINETIFAFYHELGHALIEVLPLNAVGQEEDTADEFASVMMYRKYSAKSAAEIVLDSSEYYELLYRLGNRGPGWDEHAPNDKRLFNLACFVYGSDPEQYEKVFLQKFITVHPGETIDQDQIASRAAKCEQEFAQKLETWNRLLLPHYATINPTQPTKPSSDDSSGSSRRGTYW
jgi:hypothetical protein